MRVRVRVRVQVRVCVRVRMRMRVRVAVCAPSLSTIMRSARMAEPLYSSGFVCILVLMTSMGVV